MATIANNFNPKEENEEEKGQAPQLGGPQSSTIAPTGPQPASAGVQNKTPASGRFTNISRYMGANKEAGTQLGQALGQDIQQQIGKSTGQATKAQTGFQSQLGEAGQQQQKITDYTQNLAKSQTPPQQPAQQGQQQLLSQQTGPAYLASGYQANLGDRANYAQQIANDPAALEEFLKFRSGSVASEQQGKLDTTKTAAETATQKAQEAFEQKQEQLKRDRGQLLSKLIQRPNYSLGQQNLDKAFLQMDKGDVLGQTRRNIGEQQRAFQASNLFPQLSEQYGTIRTGLADATTGLQEQTNKNLADLQTDIGSRLETLNKARQDELSRLESQFGALQRGEKVDADFAESLGLRQGQSLWNSLNNIPGLSTIADTSQLQALAQSQSDLANQSDVDLMSAFARMAETNPSLTQASTLKGMGAPTDQFVTQLAEKDRAYQDLAKKYGLFNTDVSSVVDTLRSQGITNEQMQAFANRGGSDNSLYRLLNTTSQYNQVRDPQYQALEAALRPVLGNASSDPNFTNAGVMGQYYDNFAGTTVKNLLKDLAAQGYFQQVNTGQEKKTLPADPSMGGGKGFTPKV